MNRIHPWPSQTETATSDSRVDHSVSRTAERRGLQYSLFSPIHYESNYAYPLVVWLHGDGDDESQLRRIMPLISMRNYVAVAPRGMSAAEQSGFHWRQSDHDIAQAQLRIFESIDAAREKFNLRSDRIFLAGLQGGGTMAFRIGLQNPERFAGALSVGGPFPDGQTPLTRLDDARQLPLFIAHGRNSTSYPVERACKELRLFHVAGMSVTLRQYPCGEEVHVQMLHDMDVWMMEQVTGVNTNSRTVWENPLRPGDNN